MRKKRVEEGQTESNLEKRGCSSLWCHSVHKLLSWWSPIKWWMKKPREKKALRKCALRTLETMSMKCVSRCCVRWPNNAGVHTVYSTRWLAGYNTCKSFMRCERLISIKRCTLNTLTEWCGRIGAQQTARWTCIRYEGDGEEKKKSDAVVLALLLFHLHYHTYLPGSHVHEKTRNFNDLHLAHLVRHEDTKNDKNASVDCSCQWEEESRKNHINLVLQFAASTVACHCWKL